MILQIQEAIDRQKAKGVKILKQDLASKLWPDSTKGTQKVNMYNLISGHTKSVTIDQVHILCDGLYCTADFLFNIN